MRFSAATPRDVQRQSIASDEVAPGDILLLEEGNTVPADARLLEATALQTAEAALMPVSKDVELVADDASLGDRGKVAARGRRPHFSSRFLSGRSFPMRLPRSST